MSEIRQVLLNDWDPINARGIAPEDEYDAYIGGVYRLLTKSPSQGELAQHLSVVEKKEMGFVVEPRYLRNVTKKLLKIGVRLRPGSV